MHPALLSRQSPIHIASRQHAAAHQAALRTTAHRRRNGAVLLALADRHVCRLSDRLFTALGGNTSARNIRLSAERQRHILNRRQVVSRDDADLAARRLTEALDDALYLVVPQRREAVFEVIGYVDSVDRHLLVALKLVPAVRSHRNRDEWWIQTSYPLGSKRLRQMKARGQLRNL